MFDAQFQDRVHGHIEAQMAVERSGILIIEKCSWSSLLSEGLPPGKAASNSCQGTGPPSLLCFQISVSIFLFLLPPFLMYIKKGQEDTTGMVTGVAFLAWLFSI